MQRILVIVSLLFISQAFYGQTIYINEIMASNNYTISDEEGEFDDWIEIYNSGNTNINLANYYISDDTLAPLKFKIPTNNPNLTTVFAGSYLLLWADEDLSQGANHLNFKLSNTGESLILTAPDGITLVDRMDFGQTAIDESYGRKPDGAPTSFVFSTSSPLTTNNTSVQKFGL